MIKTFVNKQFFAPIVFRLKYYLVFRGERFVQLTCWGGVKCVLNAGIVSNMKFFMKSSVLLIGAFVLSSLCSAKTPKDWKKTWIKQAMEHKCSDERSISAKKQLLEKWDKIIKDLDRFSKLDRERQDLKAPKREGYVRKWRPDALGAVFSRSELDGLKEFLEGLQSYLNGRMYYSWKESMGEKKEYRKFFKEVSNGGGSGFGFWKWMALSTVVGGITDIVDDVT